MKKNIIILCLLSLFVVGCTGNQRAKNFGGTTTVDLPSGEKLFDVTWKDDDLWYCTRKMRDNEQPEEYTFQEQSSFGFIEGTVLFKETK